MTHTYRELIIGGVLIAPIVSYWAIALIIFMLLRPLFSFVEFSRFFSSQPLAELSFFVTIFGLLTLLF